VRVRIVGTSAGWGRFVQRTAIAFLVLGLIVAGIGILTDLRRREIGQLPKAAPANLPAIAPAPPLPAATPPVTPEPSAAPAPPVANAIAETAPKNGLRLRGMGAVVVLALAEETAVQLREQPDRLADLIRQGLLFTAPNQTPVEIEEARDGLVKVRLTGSGSPDRAGWLPAGQVAGVFRPRRSSSGNAGSPPSVSGKLPPHPPQ
jgi:hypothetical protein